MRFYVPSNRIAMFSKVSTIALLSGMVASCSSGFQRFDTSLYESVVPQQAVSVSNPYPGDVDRITTASTGGRLVPAANISPRVVSQAVYHKPEPTFASSPIAQPAIYSPKPYQPYVASNANNVVQSATRRPLSSVKTYTQTALAKPAVVRNVAAYVPPKPEIAPKPVYIAKPRTDSLRTAAIQTAAPKVFAPKSAVEYQRVASAASGNTTKDGWSTANGSTIKVGQGETLYNISKRYGVPVSAIRSVNGMSPSANLRAGQTLTIPNYQFSQNATVSAPDNDPYTRASRASTGYIGEVNPSNAIVPTRRPAYLAAVSPTGNANENKAKRYVPKTHVSPPEKETTPDYSIVTGSIKPQTPGAYTVQSGDTLTRIARNNGTTVSAIQAANGLNGSNIRVGQVLRMSSGVDPVTTASIAPAKKPAALPKNVDPIVTGAVKNPAIDTKTPAPARTGISDFRWPVKGRVVSTFGESGTNGANEGIDISVPEGTAVHAAENGVVIYVGDEISSYGKLVLIRHEDDFVSAYAHNRNYEVKKGDRVRRGQIIARSGKTGNAERPKVHFELRKNSSPVNPKKYLAG